MSAYNFFVAVLWIFVFSIKTDADKSHLQNTQEVPDHAAMQSSVGDYTQMLYVEEQWTKKKSVIEPSGGVSKECLHLLNVFTNDTSTYLRCIMTNARPLHYCENCVSEYSTAMNSYDAICKELENGTTCQDQLLRADNVQVVLVVHNFIDNVWTKSSCPNCYDTEVKNGTTMFTPTETTQNMLDKIQEVQDCFRDFGNNQARFDNLSVCELCKNFYNEANVYYNKLDEDEELCSDLEDAMNYTRRMWSKEYKCNVFVRTDAVIYGMSAAVCCLPLLFYLSTYFFGGRRIETGPRPTEEHEGVVEETGRMNSAFHEASESSAQT